MKSYTLKKYENKLQASGVDWTFIEFCPLGFIGKLFVSTEIPDFIQYISLFYNDWPCDWLLATYTRTRACPLNMSSKDCIELAKTYQPYYSPPLFNHIGKYSSLEGKISKERILKKNFPK